VLFFGGGAAETNQSHSRRLDLVRAARFGVAREQASLQLRRMQGLDRDRFRSRVKRRTAPLLSTPGGRCC